MAYKILKSKHHNSTWYSDINKVDYDVRVFALKDLWPSVRPVKAMRGKPFSENLKNDIAKDGLRFPLIMVPVSATDLLDQKSKYGENICDLPFDPNDDLSEIIINVIWGGSQRFSVAKELGYTHVDCAILPNLAAAHRTQRSMRQPFMDRYYRE